LNAKIYLSGDVKKKFTIKGVSLTEGAKKAIEAAGGKVIEVKETNVELVNKAASEKSAAKKLVAKESKTKKAVAKSADKEVVAKESETKSADKKD
jgi:protein involved in polysaccharide export with SLBB domain